MDTDRPVIFFDGMCHLCSGAVDFVLRRKGGDRFLFAAQQSDAADRMLGSRASTGQTIFLIDEEGTHDRSTAVLRIAAGLGFPWSLLRGLGIIPRSWRDAVYDFIARHRLDWFGRRETCRVPSAKERDRFLG